MADVSIRHNTASPTLRDKIRLFEGKNTSTTNISNRTSWSASEFLSPSSAHRGPRVPPLPAARSLPIIIEKDPARSNVRRITPEASTLPIPASPAISTTTITTTTTTSIPITPTVDSIPHNISPRKWNTLNLDFENKSSSSTPRDKGKEKEKEKVTLEYERLLSDSEEEDEEERLKDRIPVLARSPRRPSIEQKYEEEVIQLKKLTSEEKLLVKTLIKVTTRKNKMMDALEMNIQREREALSARVEAEKEVLSSKLQALDLELATKARELSAETMRNYDLLEKIQKLERDRQDIRMALAASKRENRQCKINCDAEINKKTQSLMDMTMQLTALTCLRQSMNCIICEEKIAIAVLQPCRHMVMCGTCSQKVTKCPMCRVDIRCKFEIYNNWVI